MNTKRSIVFAVLISVAVLECDASCPAQSTVFCQSINWGYTECGISGDLVITKIDVLTLHSPNYPCIENENFGWFGLKVWVNGGCRAEFTVCYKNIDCPHSTYVSCNSNNWVYAECSAVSTGTIVSRVEVETYYSAQSTCTLDYSFGYNGRNVWVDHGCRANFKVCYKDIPCTSVLLQRCQSVSSAYTECELSDTVETISSVDLLNWYEGDCVLDQDYGWEGTMLWVTNGCNAQFQVCYEKAHQLDFCANHREAQCESVDEAYYECDIGQAAEITTLSLTEQLHESTAECVFQDTYGFYQNKIWVVDGCRAKFDVCYIPGDLPCLNEAQVTCESWSWSYKECEITEATRVTSVVLHNVLGGSCDTTSFGKEGNKIWVTAGCRATFDVCYDSGPTPSEEESGTTPDPLCYDDHPILDGLICYKECEAGYSNTGGGPMCWGLCPSSTTNAGLFCIKKTYTRGGGSPLSTCPAAQDKNGLLCYDACRSGYKGVGPLCWETCSSDYKDDGAFCRRNAHITSRDVSNCPWHDKCGLCGGPWYNKCSRRRDCGGSCSSGYRNDGCTCRRDVHIYAKDVYARGAGDAMSCPPNEEKDGGLCYPKCSSGYHGVGPACWSECSGKTIDTGAQCQKKAYGRGVGKAVNCITAPTLDDITNSTGYISIWENLNDAEILQAVVCTGVYTQLHVWIVLFKSFNTCFKKEAWNTMSLSYSSSLAFGVQYENEIGLAVDIKLGKGKCFVAYCGGIKTDASAATELSIGWFRYLSDIEGEAYLVEIGVDFPGTEVGVSAQFVLNTDEEYIGTQITIGVGVGLSPVDVGVNKCFVSKDSVIDIDIPA